MPDLFKSIPFHLLCTLKGGLIFHFLACKEMETGEGTVFFAQGHTGILSVCIYPSLESLVFFLISAWGIISSDYFRGCTSICHCSLRDVRWQLGTLQEQQGHRAWGRQQRILSIWGDWEKGGQSPDCPVQTALRLALPSLIPGFPHFAQVQSFLRVHGAFVAVAGWLLTIM